MAQHLIAYVHVRMGSYICMRMHGLVGKLTSNRTRPHTPIQTHAHRATTICIIIVREREREREMEREQDTDICTSIRETV